MSEAGILRAGDLILQRKVGDFMPYIGLRASLQRHIDEFGQSCAVVLKAEKPLARGRSGSIMLVIKSLGRH